MASLLKERARSPLVEAGVSFPGIKYVDGVAMFKIDVWERHSKNGYSVLLTRDEMLATMVEWTKQLSAQLAIPSKER